MLIKNLKKFSIIILIIFFLGSYPTLGFNIQINNKNNRSEKNFSNTLYVGGSGPGNFSNIQKAIDYSNNGDIIFVFKGIYPANIIINKSITLLGEDKDTTIIRNGQDGFLIDVDSVIIKNFTITECGQFWNRYAIRVTTNDNIIENIKIINNNKLNGIFIGYSSNNIILENDILNNPYFGIRLEYSSHNVIINNNIDNNKAFGMSLSASSNNIFISNTISSNLWGGVSVDQYCENNNFYHNNFINNNQNPSDYGINIWNDSYPSGGNYWTEYNGSDSFQGPNQDIPGSDGIGDTPYNLPGMIAIDWYPLMKPYGFPNTPIITGPIKCKIYTSYKYNFYITDPNDNLLYLRVDWGIGYPNEWSGPYKSASNISLNHTWSNKGNYEIKAQTKNTNYYESDWSILKINIPRNRDMLGLFLLNYLRRFQILKKIILICSC